jgi:hypothetical protein
VKCIYCHKQTKYKTRSGNGGRCGSCSRVFAFEPKHAAFKFTDQMFSSAIDYVSDRGAVRFQADHLLYELDRRLARMSWLSLLAYVLPAGFASFFLLGLGVPFAIIAAVWAGVTPVAVVLFYIRKKNRRTREPVISQSEVNTAVSRYEHAHGPIARLLPAVPAAAPAPGYPAEDAAGDDGLPYYNFERAVITDSRRTADLLIQNKFHFDHECVVMSLDGYPFAQPEKITAMLRANPDLHVALVHDATPAGCALPLRVRREGWFPGESQKLVDVGLRPSQAAASGLAVRRGGGRAVEAGVASLLKPSEVAWLESGNFSELAALTPRQLMRVIVSNLTMLRTAAAGGAGGGDGGFYYFGGGGDRGEDANLCDDVVGGETYG